MRFMKLSFSLQKSQQKIKEKIENPALLVY